MEAKARLTPKAIYEQFLSLNLFWLGAAVLGAARSGALVGFVPLAISVLITAMLMALAEKACVPQRIIQRRL